MKNFIEMVNERIEKEDFLTIGMQHRDGNDFDSVVPDSIIVDSKIRIKAGWRVITLSANYEFSYNEIEEEYIFKYDNLTYYFS